MNTKNIIEKTNNENIGNGYTAGFAFSLVAGVAVLTSFLFSLIITLIASAKQIQVQALIKNDFIIILSYLLGALSCGVTTLIYALKFKQNYKPLIIPTKNANNLAVYGGTLLITVGVMFGLSELNVYFVEFLNSLGVTPSTPSLPSNNAIMVVLTIITVCVMPAFFEEMLFRGIITYSLKQYGEVFAILISGALFSIFHMQASQTLYQFVFGALFAFIALRSGNILPVILSHFINNLFVVLNYYYFNITFSGGIKIAITVVSILLLIAGVIIILKATKKEETPFEKGEKPTIKSFLSTGIIGIVVCLAMWLTNLV